MPDPIIPHEPTTGDSEVTLLALNAIQDETLVGISELTLPEVQALKREIARMLPAGNLPGLILAGLTHLKGRRVNRARVEEDLSTLFNGADLLPQALYAVLYGGPAVVLSAYQAILALAGKDVSSAFPEGTWQFYLQFGLREDTGRHTCETLAYHYERPITSTEVDDITAWLMTAIHTLFDNDDLNAAIWTEWTTLRLLREAAARRGLADEEPFRSIVRRWQLTRPYRTPAGVSYAITRQVAFDDFARGYYELLDNATLQAVSETMQELATHEKPAYQRQMSLLSRLRPGRYSDERVPILLWDATVGLVRSGHIYLFDVCARGPGGLPLAVSQDGQTWPVVFDMQRRPHDPDGHPLTVRGSWLYRTRPGQGEELVGQLLTADPAVIKGMVTRLVSERRLPGVSTVDMRLLQALRSEQAALRAALPEPTQHSIEALAHTPILINWDQHRRSQPLGDLRRSAHRGVGDHPLTVVRTDQSVVFDLSHIFFDGIWGMAISEVMTNQAIAWAQYAVDLEPVDAPPPEPLPMASSGAFEALISERRIANTYDEVGAESDAVAMDAVDEARKAVRQRGVRLTVNDLLLLARVIHAATYRPADRLVYRIESLPGRLAAEVTASLEASGGVNPALLIPMDASLVSPRERIFPTTFRSALEGLLPAYDAAVEALAAYEVAPSDRRWLAFDEARRRLFIFLGAFGEMLETIKAIAMRGESFNTATIRMLAHLPPSMQSLLDQIPQRIGLLNEIVKGEEVFSNVGRVAAGSSLVRFMSARDDGRAKKLVWGIMTDDSGRMHITLRDFRSHVAVLLEAGEIDLARAIARDYVDSYVTTLNRLAAHLIEMARATGSHLPG